MYNFVIGLAIVASSLVIFFVGRDIICWYWKIDRIVSLLESINSKLDDKDLSKKNN